LDTVSVIIGLFRLGQLITARHDAGNGSASSIILTYVTVNYKQDWQRHRHEHSRRHQLRQHVRRGICYR